METIKPTYVLKNYCFLPFFSAGTGNFCLKLKMCCDRKKSPECDENSRAVP